MDQIVLRALMDPVRRDLLLHCEDGPATSAELAAKVGLSPSAARRHLRLLEDACLLAKEGTRYRGVKGWADIAQALRAMRYEVLGAPLAKPGPELVAEWRSARQAASRVMEGLAAREIRFIDKYAVRPPSGEDVDV
jgi:DNA-binding transcriptional ArsR family regulator